MRPRYDRLANPTADRAALKTALALPRLLRAPPGRRSFQRAEKPVAESLHLTAPQARLRHHKEIADLQRQRHLERPYQPPRREVALGQHHASEHDSGAVDRRLHGKLGQAEARAVVRG